MFCPLALVAQAQSECSIYKKRHSVVYAICTNFSKTSFDDTRKFCKATLGGGDVISYRSSEELEFVQNIFIRAKAEMDTFIHFVGFHQKSSGNKFAPQSGEFFWLYDTNTRVTNESKTFWQPFEQLILNFSNQSHQIKHTGNFLLDPKGNYYPGEQINGGPSATETNGNVICSRFDDLLSNSTMNNMTVGSNKFISVMMILAITMASIGLLVLIGAIIAFAVGSYKKKHQKTKVLVKRNSWLDSYTSFSG